MDLIHQSESLDLANIKKKKIQFLAANLIKSHYISNYFSNC